MSIGDLSRAGTLAGDAADTTDVFKEVWPCATDAKPKQRKAIAKDVFFIS
jgi:hypothetical protein